MITLPCRHPGLEWNSQFSRSCNKDLIESRHVEIKINNAGKVHSTIHFTYATKLIINNIRIATAAIKAFILEVVIPAVVHYY